MHVTVQIDSRWREQASRKRDTTVTVPAVRIDHREQSSSPKLTSTAKKSPDDMAMVG